MKVIYFTRFEPNSGGHGGNRRLVQILESCPRIDWELVSSECINVTGLPRKAANKIRNLWSRATGDLRYWRSDYVQHVVNWRNKARFMRTWPKISPGTSLVLMDDPVYFAPLIPWIKQNRMKLVAICHNLESLSGAQVAEGMQFRLFEQEIKLFCECDMAITISREESFVLENFGIRALFFPYFPTTENMERLARIRKKRMDSAKRNFLLLGTAGNLATRQGMLEALRIWSAKTASSSEDKLLVAGYSTESLKNHIDGDGIEFLGELSEKELDHQLSMTKACLCFQNQASGALTRIAEMLVAGIPVVANELAARSYYNTDGVNVVANVDFCQESLNRLDLENQIPPVPDKPDALTLEENLLQLMQQQ